MNAHLVLMRTLSVPQEVVRPVSGGNQAVAGCIIWWPCVEGVSVSPLTPGPVVLRPVSADAFPPPPRELCLSCSQQFLSEDAFLLPISPACHPNLPWDSDPILPCVTGVSGLVS